MFITWMEMFSVMKIYPCYENLSLRWKFIYTKNYHYDENLFDETFYCDETLFDKTFYCDENLTPEWKSITVMKIYQRDENSSWW